MGWWIGYSHQESYIQELKPLGNTPKESVINDDTNREPLNLSDHTIYTTPNIDLIKKIVGKIDEAKTQALVEVYILSEKEIKAALKQEFKNIELLKKDASQPRPKADHRLKTDDTSIKDESNLTTAADIAMAAFLEKNR